MKIDKTHLKVQTKTKAELNQRVTSVVERIARTSGIHRAFKE